MRPIFYFPAEFFCGPDLMFFVEFENQMMVPVFVQLKLRYSIKVLIEDALSAFHPTMFYQRKDGKMTKGVSNKPVIKEIIELCEKVGSIGIFVAYPADMFSKIPTVTNNTYNLRKKRPKFHPQQTIFGHSTRDQQNDQPTALIPLATENGPEKQQQLIGIIDKTNASHIFQKDYLAFLNALKNTMKKDDVDELEGDGVEGDDVDELEGNDNRSRKRRKKNS